jgi:hypothetical protein
LIVLLLVMSELLRLLWSSVVTSVLLMVIPRLIWPCYCRFVGSLVYLALTRPNSSNHVHILSQFVYTPSWVHYTFLVFYDIFVARSLTIYSFLTPARYSSRPIWILHGLVIFRIAVHF